MSTFGQRRHQVLTPALEGSKVIQPVNSVIPPGHRPFTQGGGQMLGPYHRGVYQGGMGGMFPPIGPQYMNMMQADRMQVPSLMGRPRMPYMGPPSLIPQWGGYSVGGQYFPPGFLYF